MEWNCQLLHQTGPNQKYVWKQRLQICVYLQKHLAGGISALATCHALPPCGMRHGRRIHWIYHWLIHLSEPAHVISLSIHPTCSKHKFPFSVRGQLAGLESRRRFLPISVRPIKEKLATLTPPSGKGGRGVWGLAEEWEGLTLCHKLLHFLMHPLRTATNNQLQLGFVTASSKTLLLDRRFSFGPIGPAGTGCWCHSQSAGQTNHLHTLQLFDNIRLEVLFL